MTSSTMALCIHSAFQRQSCYNLDHLVSAADELLGRSSMLSTTEVALENLAAGNSIGEACAGAVAARGLMWGNSHPAPKRWLPLKAPAWYTVNKALRLNEAELREVAARDASQW